MGPIVGENGGEPETGLGAEQCLKTKNASDFLGMFVPDVG
jgi:hypothetical protein